MSFVHYKIAGTPWGAWIRLSRKDTSDRKILIERLKNLPARARGWNPNIKAWWVMRPFVDAAARILLGHKPTTADQAAWKVLYDEYAHEHTIWYGMRLEEETLRQSAKPSKLDEPASPWKTLHLQPGAPRAVVEAAFKALARQHHPDLGGCVDRMQDINQAYQQIKVGLKAQVPA